MFPDEQCVVDGCSRRRHGNGHYRMCGMHAARMQRHGDPNVVKARHVPPTGPTHPNWGGDDIDYSAMHMRLRKYRPIADMPCVDCGRPAVDWSYNKSGIMERIGSNGYTFSTDPDQYVPRCRSCHRKADEI